VPDVKKNGMTSRKMQYWVIPPEADAEFVANMEDVLETYAKPYHPEVPVLCMDEQPVQLVKEVRQPIAATKKHPRRVDYEYERAGVANVFMFAEPLSGWREVAVRESKTKVDWAIEMANLLEATTSIHTPKALFTKSSNQSAPARWFGGSNSTILPSMAVG
jgi:hypothetical protein